MIVDFPIVNHINSDAKVVQGFENNGQMCKKLRIIHLFSVCFYIGGILTTEFDLCHAL